MRFSASLMVRAGVQLPNFLTSQCPHVLTLAGGDYLYRAASCADRYIHGLHLDWGGCIWTWIAMLRAALRFFTTRIPNVDVDWSVSARTLMVMRYGFAP